MNRLSLIERADALRLMAEGGVDILVVGGGITGAGVALDAAARGYRVGLVEKGDFASGTSSKSTKLVHGGIRYLSQFDFGLTRESLLERGRLIRNAPFLVRPVGFVLPIYKSNRRPLGAPIAPPRGLGLRHVIRTGLVTYDLMAGRLRIRRHRRISARRVEQVAPCLKTDGLAAAFLYYDAQTDDSRLTVTVIQTAALHGALVANYAEVTGFDQEDDRIAAVRVTDRIDNSTLTIKTGSVINATGVFAGRVEEMAGTSEIRITPARGVHLTVPRSVLKIGRYALVLPETEDNRLLFAVPWGSRLTIGTTDTEGGDIERPEATDEEIDYLLRHVNRYMSCPLTRSDITSVWAGYRPLVSLQPGSVQTARIPRSHVVLDGPGGMVTVVGGKLTTYRRMAQDAVDHLSRRWGKSPSRLTERLPLSGAVGWPAALQELEVAAGDLRLMPDSVRRLALYGANSSALLELIRQEPSLGARIVPDLPYLVAEVVYACRHEMAAKLEDVLDRRLHISTEDPEHGIEVAQQVAGYMARELGWDSAETARQITDYRLYAGLLSVGHRAIGVG